MKIEKGKPVTLPDGTVHSTNVAVFDAAGQQLPYVLSYDTETLEVEMLLKLKDEIDLDDGEKLCHLVLGPDYKPQPVKFILPGSYCMDEKGIILR